MIMVQSEEQCQLITITHEKILCVQRNVAFLLLCRALLWQTERHTGPLHSRAPQTVWVFSIPPKRMFTDYIEPYQTIVRLSSSNQGN